MPGPNPIRPVLPVIDAGSDAPSSRQKIRSELGTSSEGTQYWATWVRPAVGNSLDTGDSAEDVITSPISPAVIEKRVIVLMFAALD